MIEILAACFYRWFLKNVFPVVVSVHYFYKAFMRYHFLITRIM